MDKRWNILLALSLLAMGCESPARAQPRQTADRCAPGTPERLIIRHPDPPAAALSTFRGCYLCYRMTVETRRRPGTDIYEKTYLEPVPVPLRVTALSPHAVGRRIVVSVDGCSVFVGHREEPAHASWPGRRVWQLGPAQCLHSSYTGGDFTVRTYMERWLWEPANPDSLCEESVRAWNEVWVTLQGDRNGVQVEHTYMECTRQPNCPESAME
jgi:hypothetical protein